MKPLLLVALCCVSACTWVQLESSGTQVRVVASDEPLTHCAFKGEITTTVTNRVAGIERNSIKVADELETLARNEAADLGANVIQPQGQPVAGEQRFTAHHCR